MTLQKKNRHEEALRQLHTALEMFRTVKYKIGIGYCLLYTAKSHIAMQEFKLAQQKLDEVIPLLESLEQWNSLKDAYAYQVELSEKSGNHQEALTWFKKRFLAEKKILDRTQALQIAKLQVEYEFKNKEQHIDLLQKENELLALQRQSTLLHSWLLILGLAVLALATALLWRKARRESSHFRHLSQTDPLTGLYNHAYCYSLAEEEFHRCMRRKQPFVVVVADIDWFKRVNDTYGHAAGDKVLQAIAGVLQKHLGKVGIAGRTGGEEFTCFLPETDLETAIAVVRNCRQACLRPRDRFWDIPVPKIDSAVDNLLVPQPSWSPSTTQQLRKLVAAPYLAPNDWTPRSEAYFVFPLAQGTPGKQCGLAATGDYQPSLRSPWLAAGESAVLAQIIVVVQIFVAQRQTIGSSPNGVGRLS